MKAVEFYSCLMSSLDFQIGDDGAISSAKYFGSQPVMIENEGAKKRLYMPTREVLADYDKDTQVLFHPFSEYITVGESDVFKTLKLGIRLALITRISGLIESLAMLATMTDVHSRFNTSQLMFLEQVAGIDDTSVNKLKNLLSKTIVDDPDRTLLSVYMTRDELVGDTKYPRVCNIAFPFTKLLLAASESNDSKRKVLDIDVRKKTPDDIKIWLGILNYVLPDIAVPATYSRGSDHFAPYFGAALEAYYAIQSRLNYVISEFDQYISMSDTVKLVDLKWYGLFTSGTVINDLPNLSGNKGTSVEKEKPKSVVNSNLTSLAQSVLSPRQSSSARQEVDTPPWDEDSSDGGISVDEWRRRRDSKLRETTPLAGGRYGGATNQVRSGYNPPQPKSWRDIV